MGRAAARRGKNCVLTDIYGKAIDALIGSIVRKRGSQPSQVSQAIQ